MQVFREYCKEKTNVVALNSARNCLRYVIRAYGIKELFLPYYTCPVVWQVLKQENCRAKFYHIDKNFMPTMVFNSDDYVLYTNYFGICSKNVKLLSEKYKNLIVDNSQAFFMPNYGIASFNSLRKFFDVPDGAILYSDKLLNCEIETEIDCIEYVTWLENSDIKTRNKDRRFIENENRINHSSLKFISKLTKNIYRNLDIENIRIKRRDTFDEFSELLSLKNNLRIELEKDDVPMFYPYLSENKKIRRKLEQNGIFLEQFWSPMSKGTVEDEFQSYLIPVPINGALDVNFLERII